MAVALVASSAASGTTSAVISAPTGTAVSNLAVMVVGCKPYTATINTPSGWTKIGETTNGTTATGVDVGSVKEALFVRVVSDAVAATTVTGESTNVLIGSITTFSKSASEVWAVNSTTFGVDSTNGANYSATGGANISVTSGDILYCGTVINTDLGTSSSHSLSATSATLGSFVLGSDADTISGDDMYVLSGTRTVTAGTSSAAPTFTYTNASSSSGSSAFVRVRAVTPVITATFNDSANSPGQNISVTNSSTSTTFGIDHFTVTRVDISGQYDTVSVRGLDEATPAATSFPVADYESPFVSSIKYVYTAYTSSNVVIGTVESSPVTPTYVTTNSFLTGNFYIKDVETPADSKAVAIVEFGSVENSGNILGDFHILGKANPVVIVDVASSRRGTLSVITMASVNGVTLPTIIEYKKLFTRGQVLLFQSVKHTTEIPDMFFIVEGSSHEVLSRPNGTQLVIKIDVAYIEVDRPGTLSISVFNSTWQSLSDDPEYSTWADVAAENATWVDLINRY